MSLETTIRCMVERNAVHVRKGTVLGKEDWQTVYDHLFEEVQEFGWATGVEIKLLQTSFNREKAIEELADILGIVVHAAVKLGLPMHELENVAKAKLAVRFK